jgi:hypothetical protein
MVARHKMPGNLGLRSRPVGNGMIGWRGVVLRWTADRRGATDHTVPYGTDHVCPFPRHFMPVYHLLVPPGQNPVVLATMPNESAS